MLPDFPEWTILFENTPQQKSGETKSGEQDGHLCGPRPFFSALKDRISVYKAHTAAFLMHAAATMTTFL